MKKSELKKLADFFIFNKHHLSSISQDSQNTINANISRWIKDNTIINLKNGSYITTEKFHTHKNNPKFFIYLANTLRYPSYATAETILREKNILTEATYGITSFSLKTTRSYENKIDVFRYHYVKEEFYTGYKTDFFLDKKIYSATLAKALFDFLYTRSPIIPNSLKNVNLIEEFRLNLDAFTKNDLEELESYKNLAPQSKISKIINRILTK